MSYAIKQSTAVQSLVFLMIDSSDHISPKTGLSPTVVLSKNGASFVSPSGAVTEVGNGLYKVAGNATDSNTLGPLVLHATATGADPTDKEFMVVSYDPQNSVSLGLSNLDAAISSRSTLDGTGVQSALTAQGYTPTRAGYLDTLNGLVAAVWAAGTRTLTAFGFTVSATVTDKTGYSLTGAEHLTIESDVQTALSAQGYTPERATLLDTLDGLVAAVWSSLTSGMTTVGSIGKYLLDTVAGSGATAAEVWSYVTRTLTQPVSSVPASFQGGTIVVRRGDRVEIDFTDIGSLVGRTKLWITAKSDSEMLDSEALFQIEEGTGLVYLVGSPAETSEQGILTVTDAATGDLTVVLHEAATKLFTPGSFYLYDIQMLSAAGITTRVAGNLQVNADISRVVS